MQPGEFSEALLLRSVDYGESDRIITLLTRRFGKLGVIARAARRSRRRFSGGLSPLSLLNVEIRRGRGELAILSQAQVTRAYPRLLAELPRMSVGFEALAWLRELTPEHDPDDAVFAAAAALLGALDAEQAACDELLLCFQARLLALLGHAPNLRACGSCGKPALAGRAALFDVRAGHLTCRACGGAEHYFGAIAREHLLSALAGQAQQAGKAPWPEKERAAARRALRAFAEHRLGRALSVTPIAAQA